MLVFDGAVRRKKYSSGVNLKMHFKYMIYFA